jgi:hypothetical protein
MPLPHEITPTPYKPPLHAFERPAPVPPKAPERPPIVHIREGEQGSDIGGGLKVLLFVTCILVTAFLAAIFGAARSEERRNNQVAECEAKFSRVCALVAIPTGDRP